VEFICANTDAQALRRNQAKVQLQLGSEITKGLGAGANPEVGRRPRWRIAIALPN
jgi:cell division protein FtsZ